jgi:hypothetical protein
MFAFSSLWKLSDSFSGSCFVPASAAADWANISEVKIVKIEHQLLNTATIKEENGSPLFV